MHLDHPPPCPPSCDHCLAFDNVTRAICSQAPSPRSKWCAVHEELQAKLLKTYKRYTLAVESFDNSLIPPHLETISLENDLTKLRRWSETCRQKWSLVRRVIVARAEHHQQFYAGGDWGHCLFVETLKEESVKMERFLRALDRQAYAVTLAKSSASWILATPNRPSFICDEGPPKPSIEADDSKSSTIPLTPPATPPLDERPLPMPEVRNKAQRKMIKKKAVRQVLPPSPPTSPTSNDLFFASCELDSIAPKSPSELLSRLRSYLVPPPDLPASVGPQTWIGVVEGLFRHVILRIPSLATLALEPQTSTEPDESICDERGDRIDTVEQFLDLLESRLDRDVDNPSSGSSNEVEKLWRGLKYARGTREGKDSEEEDEEGLLGVGVLTDAFSNLFRTEGEHDEEDGEEEQDDSVTILGGEVWKNSYEGEWSREAWDLFYQFVACPGCTLIATRSLATWSTNRRLAALGHYPAWMAPSEGLSPMADKVFRLNRIVLCCSNASQAGRKVKRIESKEKVQKGRGGGGGKGKKVVFVEEWERSWAYCKLPIDDPQSLVLLNHLASLPSRFSILARKTASNETTHSPPTEPCKTGRGCSCCGSGDIWLNKVRSGLSPVERKAARWSTTTYFPIDTVLSSLLRSSSPENRFQPEPFTDSYDCLILDASPYTSLTHDSWSLFADSLANAILESRRVESVGELSRVERAEAVERGELEEGEWERMCAAAKPEQQRSKVGGSSAAKKVVYVCEEGLTARGMWREDW